MYWTRTAADEPAHPFQHLRCHLCAPCPSLGPCAPGCCHRCLCLLPPSPCRASPTIANDCFSPQQEAAHEVGSAAHDVGSAVKEDATAAKDKMADAASAAGESAKVSARECCAVGGAGRNLRGFVAPPGERMADAASSAGESA